MFQRLKDTYVKRILRRIPPDRAAELTDEHWLRSRAAGSGCPASGSTELLRTVCDLSKTADGQSGICSVGQGRACFLHQHTVLLRRYSHFGKVPTSIALAIREAGAAHIGELHALAIEGRSPDQAALWLEAALTRAWRVSDKIAAMFLSLVCNPDLGSGAPWSAGVDWTHFVVIDVNVDHYLRATGYSGPWTYRARRAFIRDLAFAIRLDDLDSSLQRTNPRLVQQALYLFMSSSNRRELPVDCLHRQGACRECRPELAQICPVRASS